MPPQHFVQLHDRQRGVLCATAALCTATLQTKRCTTCHRSTLYSYITDKEVYYVPPQHFVQLHYRQRGVLCATAALCTATLQTKRCTMCHRSTLYNHYMCMNIIHYKEHLVQVSYFLMQVADKFQAKLQVMSILYCGRRLWYICVKKFF